MEVVQSFPEACLPAQNRVERLFTDEPHIEVPEEDITVVCECIGINFFNTYFR
jgi:hypothetical protein